MNAVALREIIEIKEKVNIKLHIYKYKLFILKCNGCREATSERASGLCCCHYFQRLLIREDPFLLTIPRPCAPQRIRLAAVF